MVFMALAIIAMMVNFTACTKRQNVYEADVVIYGGTSAAVIAAVEVVQSGKSVIVVSPDQHLGGLTSGGLGFTDTGKKIFDDFTGCFLPAQ